MKIEIEFNNKFKKVEDVKQVLKKENLNKLIKEIIDDNTIYGKNIINWKGETVFIIKFVDFE